MENQNKNQIDVSVLLNVLTALKNGDTTARMPIDMTGMAGKVADTLNQIIINNHRIAQILWKNWPLPLTKKVRSAIA